MGDNGDDALQPILIAGDWRAARKPEGDFRASNPTTGALIGQRFPISGADDIEAAIAAAVDASAALSTMDPELIATFLERYADGIEAAAEQLVAIAHSETALPAPTRLAGNELPRTTGQLRQAAAAVLSRAWTNPVVDTKAGLRSHLASLGKPVLVFGPNNFPFAFNAIAGSDFASAIAARNAVIAKAHPSHPATSQLLAQIAHQAARDARLPLASVQLLYDIPPTLGAKLCADRRLGAIGFTGSRKAGLALKAAADSAGIAMYAEMSSVNPVFLLDGALRERGDALADEVFGSCMLGSGQFCTNPGLLIVPHGTAGDAFVASLSEHFSAGSAATVFSAGVQRDADANLDVLRMAGANVLACASGGIGEGFRVAPTLLGIEASDFIDDSERLQIEVFGPVNLVIRADNLDQMIGVARALEGNLTGSIFTASDGSDDASWQAIGSVLRNKVGRLIQNRMPTGVAVSSAMQHGGPFPASSHSGFTSVGMPASIRRFATLQSYDQVSDARLPKELRDANPLGIQRCVDGEWTRNAIKRPPA